MFIPLNPYEVNSKTVFSLNFFITKKIEKIKKQYSPEELGGLDNLREPPNLFFNRKDLLSAVPLWKAALLYKGTQLSLSLRFS